MRTLLMRVWKTAEEALQRVQAIEGQAVPPPPPPLPVATQIVYVNKGGNDGTGNGTINAPYLTVSHALTTITDASGAKKYTVLIGPGVYGNPLALKSGITLVGEDPAQTTSISGAITIDPGFANNGFTGLSNLALFSTAAINWGTITDPLINLFNCTFENPLGMSGGATDGYFVIADTCRFSNVSFTDAGEIDSLGCFFGGNVLATATHFQFIWNSDSDAFQLIGAMTITGTAGFLMQMNLISSQTKSLGNTLTLNGANTSFNATAGGVPGTIVLAGGANPPVLTSFANSLNYAAAVVGNWSGVNPTSVQNALDRIAAKITPIP